MKFVVDTNILFSAVLNTQGKIGDLLMNSQGIFQFCACDTLRAELAKHRSKLLELSQLSEAQLDQSIYQITACLSFTN
jgi:predicted nucleic acid-binding protein